MLAASGAEPAQRFEEDVQFVCGYDVAHRQRQRLRRGRPRLVGQSQVLGRMIVDCSRKPTKLKECASCANPWYLERRTTDTEEVPMTYLQRQAIRTLRYGPAVKVGIKFKTRWWEQANVDQRGGSSYTDRQRRVVYPSYGLGEGGPGVLMVTYNWQQDATRFGSLIQNPDWSDQLDPDRVRPRWEQVLLDQIYADLATLHDVDADWLREETLDYHAFDWYHNPYTMGAFASFAPGQFSTFFADIIEPAVYGRFHFAGEVASAHHAWVAGVLDSVVRVVDHILCWDSRV